jgi:protein JSN1
LFSEVDVSFATQSCAFVNFIDKADAIRAKDDVLIRLGGHITELSDTPVRVGYGKIDSVPTAAPTASTMQYSLSNSSLSSLASENGDSEQRIVSQNSPDITTQPTRALWIGSIPATTTPGTLLSIFSPFGPVESARVLTNKQCGFINFETISSAVAARTALNGREVLGSEVGAVKIGFARIPVKSAPSDENGMAGGPVIGEHGHMTPATSGTNIYSALKEFKGSAGFAGDAAQTGMENVSSNLVLDLLQKGVHDDVRGVKHPESASGASDAASSTPGSDTGITEQQMIMMVFSQGDPSMAEDVLAIAGKHVTSNGRR